MIPRTNILLDTTSAPVTGAFTGDWYAFQPDGRTHNIIGIDIVSGTGTVILEGRNDPNSAVTTVVSVTIDDSELVAAFKQFRIRITGGTALVVKATLDKVGKKV